MRVKHLIWLAIEVISFSVHAKSLATQPHVCDLIKKQKNAGAYLIDEKGNIQTRTLNYGNVTFKNPLRSDYLSGKTNFKIVIYPARELIIEKPLSTGADYLDFKKTNPACPNTKTFSVIYMKRIIPSEVNSIFKDDFEYEMFSAVEYLDGGSLEVNNPKVIQIVGQIKAEETYSHKK